MTTAKRTTLVHHLHLDIGYEQDITPAVLADAILEALEPALIDEMGIVFIQAESAYTPGAGTLTIYAPLDQVREPNEPEGPPERPTTVAEEPFTLGQLVDEWEGVMVQTSATGANPAPKVCPDCGKGADLGSHHPQYHETLCDDCKRKPNVG